MQEFLFEAADDPRFIGVVNQFVFLLLLLLCAQFSLGVSRHLCLPAFPQELQVHSVKNQPALWSVKSNICDVFSSEITAAQDNGVIFPAVLAKMLANALNVWMVNNFDAALPELISIGRNIRKIVWNERDAVPQVAQD